MIVERIQVIAWISFPFVAWYLGHLESGRNELFFNFLSEGRMIVISYLLSSDNKVFDASSQLRQRWLHVSWLISAFS